MRNKRIIFFEFIRVISIGLVIAVHVLQKNGSRFGGFFGWPGIYYVSLGGVGVTIFLILKIVGF